MNTSHLYRAPAAPKAGGQKQRELPAGPVTEGLAAVARRLSACWSIWLAPEQALFSQGDMLLIQVEALAKEVETLRRELADDG